MHKEKKWWTKKKITISSIILVLTLVGLLLDLPKKMIDFYESITGSKTPTAPVTSEQTQQTMNGNKGTQINENKGVINIDHKAADTVKVKK